MSIARKRAFNSRSMSTQSRNAAIAAIQICWQQMRTDLHGDKDAMRDERLAWITSFLRLKNPLESIKDLSDGQIGLVLDEMRNMTGAKAPAWSPQQKGKIEREHRRLTQIGNVISIADFVSKKPKSAPVESETVFLTSDEQFYTLEKLVNFIGWNDEQTQNFLKKRKFAPSLRMQEFDRATALTMILLNIAADKDLRAQGKTKISRAMTAKHIPILKQKLQIDR